MSTHDQKLNLLRKYRQRIGISFNFLIEGEISENQLTNAIKNFANGINPATVIGFCVPGDSPSGFQGYLFTDSKVFSSKNNGSSEILCYDDIKSVEILEPEAKDNEKGLRFNLIDGTSVVWWCLYMNKTPLCYFFRELLKMDNSYMKSSQNEAAEDSDNAAYVPGLEAGEVWTINKLFEEVRFHANQGHGFAAERANDQYDRVTGHKTAIVGDDNAKNGADRMVDGIQIQSKYCATGAESIDACFEGHGSGNFRYYTAEGTPMEIEVPSDQYDAAVEAMEKKILKGQVEGVTDPAEAKNIVRKGHVTYAQAKNIAKAGTVESITYDAISGAIISTSAFGITAMVTFASSIWNGDDFDVALKTATYSGLRVCGTTFVSSVLASQLSKAGLNSALVSSSEAIVGLMGPKASAVLVNAFRGSSGSIYGAAAMKSAAKLLRGNVITGGVTIVVLSAFDIANIFRGRISGKQLFKNMAGTASTVAGGTAGFLAGTVILGPLGFVGGLIGSLVVGSVANKATNVVVGEFIEDDADEMVRIIEKQFGKLSEEYLMTLKEAENVVDKLQKELDGQKLKDMYASYNRKEFADKMIIPLIEEEISKRKKISVPTSTQMTNCLKEILEEIADNSEEELDY